MDARFNDYSNLGLSRRGSRVRVPSAPPRNGFVSSDTDLQKPRNLVFTGLFCFLSSDMGYCKPTSNGGIVGGTGVRQWGYPEIHPISER